MIAEELRTSFSSSEQNSQKVALELQEIKKKLRDQRRTTDNMEKDNRKLTDLLRKSCSSLSSVVSDMSKHMGDSDKSDLPIKAEKDVKKEVNGEN